jgi:hypothetical protein
MEQVEAPVGEDHALATPLQFRHNVIRTLKSQNLLNAHNKVRPLPK